MYSIFNQEKLEEFRQKEKLQPFRVKQIYHNIFKNSIIDFDSMTDLSKDLRAKLKNNFYIVSLQATEIIEGEETTKIGFKNTRGHSFESVLMFHKDRIAGGKHDKKKKSHPELVSGSGDAELNSAGHKDNLDLNRITLCVSSQIGCAVGCKFCVTGKLGFIDNLSAEEILEQVLWSNNYIKSKFGKKEDNTWYKVRNVVYMGMGEPLLNYDNVKKSIEYLLDQTKLSLSKRHVTISTSGIVPGIKKMLEDELTVMLAISLHSANPKTREDIMPITERYSLDELMEVLDEYVKQTNNRVFYEYIMIKNKTDTIEQAKYLAKLLKNRLAHVNLIPYNENPVVDYETSPRRNIEKFKEYLEKYNITTTIRQTMGAEKKGACGQLGYEKVNRKFGD